MAQKEIVLVAGFNYTEYPIENGKRKPLVKANPGPWRDFCVRWAKKKFLADSKLKITLFDFFTGTRENISFSKGKAVFTVEVKGKQLDFSNYRRIDLSAKKLVVPEKRFAGNDKDGHISYLTGCAEIRNGDVGFDEYFAAFLGPKRAPPKETSFSITDVYDYLIEVGKKRPGTLAEFHLFSHAFAGGPILVNSRSLTTSTDTRDVLDKDPRATMDFNGKNVKLDLFPKAFTTDAVSFVWGCIVFTFMKRLIQGTNRQKPKIPKDDDPKFLFTWSEDWGSTLEFFHNTLGGDTKSNDSAKLTLQGIKTVTQAALNDTYMQALATASKAWVMGALPGTYTDLDSSGSLDNRFLHVPIGAKSNNKSDENFIAALIFYDKVMGVNFEPSAYGGWPPYGRGFGIYIQ